MIGNISPLHLRSMCPTGGAMITFFTSFFTAIIMLPAARYVPSRVLCNDPTISFHARSERSLPQQNFRLCMAVLSLDNIFDTIIPCSHLNVSSITTMRQTAIVSQVGCPPICYLILFLPCGDVMSCAEHLFHNVFIQLFHDAIFSIHPSNKSHTRPRFINEQSSVFPVIAIVFG